MPEWGWGVDLPEGGCGPESSFSRLAAGGSGPPGGCRRPGGGHTHKGMDVGSRTDPGGALGLPPGYSELCGPQALGIAPQHQDVPQEPSELPWGAENCPPPLPRAVEITPGYQALPPDSLKAAPRHLEMPPGLWEFPQRVRICPGVPQSCPEV